MPPTNDSTSHISMFFSWVWANTIQIGSVITAAGILIATILRIGKRTKEYEELKITVNTAVSDQEKIISLIPKDSWENGTMLINENDCMKARIDCRTRVIVDDLKEAQVIQKEALAYIIRHDDKIPEAKRDELFEKLLR